MLKTILKWKKHPKDVRFVKFEQYKSQVSSDVRGVFSTSRAVHKTTQLSPSFSPPISSNAMLMDIDIDFKDINRADRSDSEILVSEGSQENSVYDKKPFPFATVRAFANDEASSKVAPIIDSLNNTHYQAIPSYPVEYGEPDSAITVDKAYFEDVPFVKKDLSFKSAFKRIRPLSRSANCELTKSLGIFSDTKMYSALIQSELQPYELNIQHFNHPNSFTRNRYSLFDNVSAWIIYLSEKGSDEFLERFIERYFEKPTLFLFAKTKRITTTQKLKTFILDNDLVTNKYLYEDI